MFCIWCGAQVDDDSQFCPECGSNLHPGGVSVQTPPPAAETPPVQSPPAEVPPPQKSAQASAPPGPAAKRGKSKGLLIGILIAVICILAAVVVILFLKLNNVQSQKQTANDRPSVSDIDRNPVEQTDTADASMPAAEATATPAPTQTPEPEPEAPLYIIPDSDSRYLTRSDLIGLSSDELRIARNEIYARHGRMFNDEALQNYFDRQPWYRGTIAPDDFSQSLLNDYEVKNAALILEYESER